MAASMHSRSVVYCRKIPPVYPFLCGPRLLMGFTVKSRVPLFHDLRIFQQYIRKLSTMQSMRIPKEKVYRPKTAHLDVYQVSMYKLRKNLELRRYVPITAFIKTQTLAKDKALNGEPLSNSEWSELLSMTGEVLNVHNSRRTSVALNLWNFLKSLPGYKFDVSNYTNYLMVCKENEQKIDITSLTEEMKLAGLTPNQLSDAGPLGPLFQDFSLLQEFFEELVGYHSAHGQVESVKEVLQEMKSSNFQMTAKILSNCIWAEFNAGYKGDLTAILESMSCAGVAPDLNCYMTMMKCYAVQGKLDEIEMLINTAEEEAGMRQTHRLQLLLPLLLNKHEAKAEKLFGTVCCLPYHVERSDVTEIEYYGNQLVVNMQTTMGFKVYNLLTRTAPFFIRSFARGPGKRRNDHLSGYNMLNMTAARLTVNMVKNNVITWNRMLLEAKTISKEYTALIFLEAKNEGILKRDSYENLCFYVEKGPSSKYFENDSKRFLKNVASACLVDDKSGHDPASDVDSQPNIVYGVRQFFREIENDIKSGNDDEVIQRFDEMKHRWSKPKISSIAKHLVILYREKKKFDSAMYFLDVMVRANPSFPYTSSSVTLLITKMLECGEHTGIVKCINDYFKITRELGKDMAVIPHSQLLMMLKVLIAFLRPAEVLQILGRIKAYHDFLRIEFKTFLNLYLERDVSLAVEALEEMMKHSKTRKFEYLQIMVKLVQREDHKLLDKVYLIASRREGKSTADLLLTGAHLINDQVEEARQLNTETNVNVPTVGKIRDVHIIACVILLQNKPDMLNILVELQDIPDLRLILAEVLKSGFGSHYENTKKILLQYIAENPGSALDEMCSSMMEPDQMELEKLRLKMVGKVS